MRKPSESDDEKNRIESLIGLGNTSARKSYYPELLRKIDELEAEKDRYKWLFENALHGIFQARLDGPLLAANPALARICGYPSAADLQAAISDLGCQLFRSPKDYRRLLTLLMRDGQRMGFETQLWRASGDSVEVSLNVLVKDRDNGVIEAFVADITERKKAQRELNRLNENLEQRVQARTEELSTVNHQLLQEILEREEIQRALTAAKLEAEQANRSKDKYLAAASHDLLQPLNAARLSVATLLERPQEPRNQQLVERIHLALQGAEDLLTDLLDIAKLDANTVQPDITRFNIGPILQSLTMEFLPVARKAGLTMAIVPCSLSVDNDARLLIRILRNLISNAIRYTPSGRVLLGCRRRGGKLRIEVWDTGPGIPSSQLEEIFQEFRQLDNAQTSRDKGVGLGLAIVERITRMLGHRVEVSSWPGHGSCFAVELSASRGIQPAKLPPILAPVDTSLQGLRVLVVENEEAILSSMRALLEEWGCTVITAVNLEQARTQVDPQANLPQIVLADYHLDQGEMGTDVIRALRAAWSPNLPGVMITADRGDELRQQLKELGLPRLNKPVKPGKLRALLSHVLQHASDV